MDRYDATAIEARWQQVWEDARAFYVENPDDPEGDEDAMGVDSDAARAPLPLQPSIPAAATEPSSRRTSRRAGSRTSGSKRFMPGPWYRPMAVDATAAEGARRRADARASASRQPPRAWRDPSALGGPVASNGQGLDVPARP